MDGCVGVHVGGRGCVGVWGIKTHLFDAITSCCMHFMPYILYKLCTVMDGQYLQLWLSVLSSFCIT